MRRPGHRPRRRAAEWVGLGTRLAKALACLEDGHFVILATRNDDAYYVQFAAGGPQGMQAEAVSNRFLEGWRRLDRTAGDHLRRLGWRPPTEIGDGLVNWWRCFDTSPACRRYRVASGRHAHQGVRRAPHKLLHLPGVQP